MRYRIRTRIERPDRALIERVGRTHVGVTGTHAGPRQVADPAIKPLRSEWRICGPAFTVRPEYSDDLLLGEIAAKYAQPGDVIVVDAAGRLDRACWGMGMSTGAKGAGCAGVVIDGACMNGALLIHERPQLPIFARGLVAGASGAERAGWINEPVVCGGVIVLADADGVVFIPPELADEILAPSEAFQARAPADRAAGKSYYELRGSEAKLRALGNVEWFE